MSVCVSVSVSVRPCVFMCVRSYVAFASVVWLQLFCLFLSLLLFGR